MSTLHKSSLASQPAPPTTFVQTITARFQSTTWYSILLYGLLLRIGIVIYGRWQDQNMQVKYTDIDYFVYSDASRFIAQGLSPYQRATYRYTPLLAYMLLPAVTYPSFGLILFCLFDLVLCHLAYHIFLLRGLSTSQSKFYSTLILFNPIVINVSTRGNADVIIVTLVTLMLFCLLKQRLVWAAMIYGLCVHFKIYPVIYAPAILFFLNKHYYQSSTTPLSTQRPSGVSSILTYIQPIYPKLLFSFVSFGTFSILTYLCYVAYGYEGIYETYLYHVIRKDTRHNFSVYFYQLYLTTFATTNGTTAATMTTTADASPLVQYSFELFAQYINVLSFLPQIIVLLFVAFSLYEDLPLCMFVQTLLFVAFNKVMTAQYFLWWLIPLCIILPQISMNKKNTISCIASWFGTELFWLSWGYRVEFLGESAFFGMWISGLLFFTAHIFMLCNILLHVKIKPLFFHGQLTRSDDSDKSS